MPDSNIVILARPHPFIAKHMTKFLTDNGYTPHPIKHTKELALLPPDQVKGAVISTSVISDVEEGYEDVFHKIRDRYPGLPIMFATLGNPADMILPLERALGSNDFSPTVVEVKFEAVQDRRLGNEDLIVLIHKNCLTTEKGLDMTAKMVKSHFG